MMRSVRAVIGIGVLASAAGVAGADLVLLNPVKDNTIYETDATSDTSNGRGMHLYSAAVSFGPRRRPLMAFDLSSIPAGSTITGARLTLYLDHSSPPPPVTQEVTLHRVLADWGEGISDAGEPGGIGAVSETNDASWNYRFYPTLLWSQPGGDFVAAPSATTTVGNPLNSYSWGGAGELVADVQGWFANPATNFGWLLMGDESQLGSGLRFNSRENTTPPVLAVIFTPPVTCGSPDFDCDGDIGTDADIEAFFACLGGNCPAPPCESNADFNNDGDIGTDADIESFFRVLAGGPC
jgi:hypothetical protein